MSDASNKTNVEREILVRAQEKGKLATSLAYVRLSGPGWLQSAITLGGGSLTGSLYLGILAGISLLWLQPLFMILGIIMLSAIGYVSLSTGERPFRAINKHVNPVLGWSWAAACLMANIVWCMPQFALANSVFQFNLFPDLYSDTMLGSTGGKILISAIILVLTTAVTWCYGSGHWGVRVYEFVLKLMVAGIVISFVLVVISLTQSGQLQWGEILGGFLPNPFSITRPAPEMAALIEQVPEDFRDFWTDQVTASQRDRMVTAAATAVGINMTFLFPYSLLRKGWTREFRGLMKFDLATGMFIPFVLATSCVVIASASQFHAQPVPGLVDPASSEFEPTAKERSAFYGSLKKRLTAEIGAEAVAAIESGQLEMTNLDESEAAGVTGIPSRHRSEIQRILGQSALERRMDQLPEADRMIAATLVDRDANRLATSLAPLDESGKSDLIFGLGVVGMTLSTITILMLISGFVICEVFNLPMTGWPFRIACSVAAIGVLGPFVWQGAGFALAVPTSVFGFMLLPIAYLTFFLLMNQKSLLKDDLPTGGKRVAWNVLMAIAAGIATVASGYMVWTKAGWWGVGIVGGLLGLALIVQIARWINPPPEPESAE